jgi:hypothetical protein
MKGRTNRRDDYSNRMMVEVSWVVVAATVIVVVVVAVVVVAVV